MNSSADWVKDALLSSLYGVLARRLIEYIGGKSARVLNVAWNDPEYMNQ